MRFEAVWSEALTENKTLRLVVCVLGIACMGLTFVSASLSLRKPVVIERGSGVVQAQDAAHTESEVISFVEAVLEARFNSGPKHSTFWLSESEREERSTEQKALSEKAIEQTVLIRKIELQGHNGVVSLDRILAMGEVRSALPVKLHVEIRSVPRSGLNPFGLILERTKAAN